MSGDILRETLRQMLNEASQASERDAEMTREVLLREPLAMPSALAETASAREGEPTQSRADAESRLVRELARLADLARLQSDRTEENTRAVIENSLSQANGSGGGTIAGVGKTLTSFLGGGFGLARLVGGLLGGESKQEPEEATSFLLPAQVNYEAALSGAGAALAPIRYGQEGLPRAAAAPVQPANITVQVEAMDSRSFIDRSEEIALAVKRALLDSHSLNDVVAEL